MFLLTGCTVDGSTCLLIATNMNSDKVRQRFYVDALHHSGFTTLSEQVGGLKSEHNLMQFEYMENLPSKFWVFFSFTWPDLMMTYISWKVPKNKSRSLQNWSVCAFECNSLPNAQASIVRNSIFWHPDILGGRTPAWGQVVCVFKHPKDLIVS